MKKKNEAATFGVIGLDKFGLALVECLARSDKEVLAIDKDEAKVKEASHFTEYAMVVESLDEESLLEAEYRIVTRWLFVLRKRPISASSLQ